jgi:uncharacterized membrane protein
MNQAKRFTENLFILLILVLSLYAVIGGIYIVSNITRPNTNYGWLYIPFICLGLVLFITGVVDNTLQNPKNKFGSYQK